MRKLSREEVKTYIKYSLIYYGMLFFLNAILMMKILIFMVTGYLDLLTIIIFAFIIAATNFMNRLIEKTDVDLEDLSRQVRNM